VFDCGLFLLHYAEQLCTGLDELFSDEKTPSASKTALRCMFERRRSRFWFDQARITEKRKEVHKLIEFIETRTAASATAAAAAVAAAATAAAAADDQTQPMDE
jgi:anti-sigma-K factor RskA